MPYLRACFFAFLTTLATRLASLFTSGCLAAFFAAAFFRAGFLLRTGAFATRLPATGFFDAAFLAGAFFATFAFFGASRRAIADPSSAGERTVVTRAASSAANLSAAVPLPPEITAPACPMRLPGGAVTPAM